MWGSRSVLVLLVTRGVSRAAPAALLAITLAALAWPSPAEADVVDVTSRTLLSARREARDGELRTVVPAYQFLTLRGTELSNPAHADAEVVLSLWGSAAGGDPRDGRSAQGDIDVGFVQGRFARRRLTIRAGRQLMVGGAIRNTQVDGLALSADVGKGAGLSAFGGIPVVPRFGADRNDLAAGGRAFWRGSPENEVGVSFVHVLDDGDLARQDVGLDFWQALPLRFTLGGFGLVSLAEQRLAEGDLSATWRPRRTVKLSGGLRRTAPDLYISRTSIFSVFAEGTRNEAGGAVSLRAHQRLVLDGAYYRLSQDDIDQGYRGSARMVATLGRLAQTNLGIEGRALDQSGKGYFEGRLYAVHRPGARLALTIDGDAYRFREPVNGRKESYTLAATAGYAFLPGWQAMLAGVAGSTPFYQSRYEATVRLTYNATLRFREIRP